MIELNKELGQVFTPSDSVKHMVEMSKNYLSRSIFDCNILEPSVGDGAFIRELNKYTDNIDIIDIDARLVEFVSNKYNISSSIIGNTLLTDFDKKYDLIIGNPPYGLRLSKQEKETYKEMYSDVHNRTIEIFNLFISKCLRLLEENGLLCLIVPNVLLTQGDYEKTRRLILNNYKIERIINLGEGVFNGVDVPSCVILIRNTRNISYRFNYTVPNGHSYRINKLDVENFPYAVIGVQENQIKLFNKVREKSIPLHEIAVDISYGISTGNNKAFLVDKVGSLEGEKVKPLIRGRDIDYFKLSTSRNIIHITNKDDLTKYPKISEHLKVSVKNKKHKFWWCLHRPRKDALFSGEKIIIRQTSDRIVAAYDDNGFYSLDSVVNIKLKNKDDYKFVLGVLNSNVVNSIYRILTQEDGRTFAQVKPQKLKEVLIPSCSNGLKESISNIVDRILNDSISVTSGIQSIDKLLVDLFDIDEFDLQIQD